jgi:hypothetical protein
VAEDAELAEFGRLGVTGWSAGVGWARAAAAAVVAHVGRLLSGRRRELRGLKRRRVENGAGSLTAPEGA